MNSLPPIVKIASGQYINANAICRAVIKDNEHTLSVTLMDDPDPYIFSTASSEAIALLEALDFLDRQRRIEWKSFVTSPR